MYVKEGNMDKTADAHPLMQVPLGYTKMVIFCQSVHTHVMLAQAGVA